MHSFISITFFVLFSALIPNCNSAILLKNNVVSMEAGKPINFEIVVSNSYQGDVNRSLILISQHDDVLLVVPNHLEMRFNKTVMALKHHIIMSPMKYGKTSLFIVVARISPDVACEDHTLLSVQVYKSTSIEILSKILGWLYFFAWSLSFYPQIYINHKRKSVVGLSFDFILFNMFGYIMYNIFNIGLFFIPEVKEQYALRNPRSINPVYPNDILFTGHCLIAALITIIQYAKYQQGKPKISLFAKVFLMLDFLAIVIVSILACCHLLQLLDVLYICSYLKLIVTVSKYVPQVYMNYKRKTTQGFSIESVVLDFTGGVLSLLQMILDSYNYGNWSLLEENPTKFGLGIISTIFDMIFLAQRFIVYGASSREEKPKKPAAETTRGIRLQIITPPQFDYI